MFSEAWCSVKTEGVLHMYSLTGSKILTAACSRLVCPFQPSCHRYTLKIHMMHRTSFDILWVSAGHCAPPGPPGALDHQGRLVLCPPPGQAPHRWESSSLILLPAVGLQKLGPKTNTENRFLSRLTLSEHYVAVTQCQSIGAKTVSASCTLIKKRKKA